MCAVDVAREDLPLPQGKDVGTPLGRFEGVREGVAYGWSLDPDAPVAHVTIQLYLQGTYGEGKPIATGLANLPAPRVNRDLGQLGDHGFAIPVPHDAHGKRVHVYAVNVGRGRDRLLNPEE